MSIYSLHRPKNELFLSVNVKSTADGRKACIILIKYVCSKLLSSKMEEYKEWIFSQFKTSDWLSTKQKKLYYLHEELEFIFLVNRRI